MFIRVLNLEVIQIETIKTLKKTKSHTLTGLLKTKRVKLEKYIYINKTN